MGSTGLRFPAVLVCVFAALAAPRAASAADKDVIELQRQVAGLSEQVRNMQSALSFLQSAVDQKLGAQGALLQQALDGVNQARGDNAASSKMVAAQLSQEEQKVAVPIAALNAKIDQMLTAFSTAADNIGDMNSRLGKLEQQIVDLGNAVKALQTAAPQPAGNPQAGAPPPGVTAEGLYNDASRDQLAGHYPMAFEEFSNYLKYFGDTDSAGSAQFHIGEIQLKQGNFERAIQAFDAVAAQYPKNAHASEALYQKAQALKSEGQRADATRALRDLVRLYPDSESAARARTELAAPPRTPSKK